MPYVPRYAPEARGRICEDMRKKHYRPRSNARKQSPRVVCQPAAHRPRTNDWQTAAGRNKQPPALPCRSGTGLPHPEPHGQHPVGWRKSAHQPDNTAGQLARWLALRARRAVDRLALARHRPAHQCATAAPRRGKHSGGCGARRGDNALSRLPYRRWTGCRTPLAATP